MSDDDWEALADSDAELEVPEVPEKKEGDGWDEEEEESEPEPEPEPTASGAAAKYVGLSKDELIEELLKRDKAAKGPKALTAKQKRKKLKEREEEEKKRREAEAEAAKEVITPEEAYARKLELQKKVEAADLEMAKELFGDEAGNENAAKVTLIEAMNPETAEDFKEMGDAIVRKLSKYSAKPEYPIFLHDLARDLVLELKSDEIRKIGSALSVLASEKQKEEKAKAGAGGKKKKAKAQLAGAGKGSSVGRAKMADLEEDYYGGEYDDFM